MSKRKLELNSQNEATLQEGDTKVDMKELNRMVFALVSYDLCS